MDFDVAPVVRRALLDAVDREDFGYVEADLGALTGAAADVPRGAVRLGRWRRRGSSRSPTCSPGSAPPSTCSSRPARRSWCRRRRTRRSSRSSSSPAGPWSPRRWCGPATTDALDLDAIDAGLAAGARAVLLCNPHNPTGRVFTRDELDRARRDRRAARRAGRRRRGARAARVRRCASRAVRVGVGRDRRAHGHRHVGVEGVQPRRA